MYKERPKIDAEQQWIETGKAFLALFIAEPEFARKAVEIAPTISELTCKHATIIRELQLVSDLMVTIKRRIEEIDGTSSRLVDFSLKQKPPGNKTRGDFS